MDLVMHKRISAEMKEVCAVFGDGMYLFAKSYEHMPWLLSEIAVLPKAKVLPKETAREIVYLREIKALCDGAATCWGGPPPTPPVPVTNVTSTTETRTLTCPTGFEGSIGEQRTKTTRTTTYPWGGSPLVTVEAEADRSLEAEGVAPQSFSSRRALGMRYLGQSWEIDVDVPPDMATVEELEAAFHDTHERRFGHRNDGETEVVSFRLTGIGRGGKPASGAWRVPGDLTGARVETRAVFFGGRFFDTPVLERGRLPAGASHAGPAIVEEEGATTVVPPEWRFQVLDSGDLLMERGDA